ncbi:McrC family protein [Citreicella sp. C3M06]|uniref:McrC family protein n=1 Tax=Citreicella sp. C3M06 TaxID=2841564 RepID=UPI001C098F55|nr:McrC family protein [Citreicella sp. C3M06]MBU2961984.1 McrC family protein [Citreicella sp. C3M06]
MLFPEADVVEIEERGRRFFPRSDLIDQSGHSLILPETRDLKAIELRDVTNGVDLMALGLIGFLPLTSRITLNIVPKFPIENLWSMLEIGGEDYSHILPTIRSYQGAENPAPILLLARSFCHYLRGALSTGFERTYYTRTLTGYYKPRVEFGRTISTYLSRGNPIETVSSVYEFGLDSPANKVIKSACLRFSRLIPRSAEWEGERRILQIALDFLRRVQEREPSSHDFFLDETVSLRLRENYAGMLRVYHLLVTGGGIAFSFAPGGRELPSFLFNLEDIFEKFIRVSFGEGLRARKISVLDGNKHQGKLFTDSKVYPTKSDVIFRRGKKNVIALGEVKYKPKLKEADRYQIISHVTAAGAPLGVLFSPANEGESQGLRRLGKLPTGAEFYHYLVNIRGDIREAQGKMVKEVGAILK